MDFTKFVLLLSVLGVTLGLSSTNPSGTERPKSWFNFWDTPVVGNSQSSGTWTPGPQAGGAGQPVQGGPAAQSARGAAQGAAVSNNRAGSFNWFQNSVVDPGTGGGSSTPPPNVDVWANPDAGPMGGVQTGHQALQGEGHFGPDGGFYPETNNNHHHNQNSGEHHSAAGPMAQPGAKGPDMAGGVGEAGGNPGMAGGIDRTGGRGGAKAGIPNLPYNVGDMQRGNTGGSASSGVAAGTLVGVAVAVIVVVGVFAGAAYILTRQRRINHVVMANV